MIDLTKPVQTRDGRAVRIYRTDAKGSYPIHGCVLNLEADSLICWRKCGMYGAHGVLSDSDLVNVPEKHVRYVNYYKDSIGLVHKTRAGADNSCTSKDRRVACIRVEFEEGQYDQ